MISIYREGSCAIPFPERLPFDSVFVSFGDGLGLTELQASMRVRPSTLEEYNVIGVSLHGFLLFHAGDTSEAYSVVSLKTSKETSGTAFIQVFNSADTDHADGPWSQPMSLDPWTVPMIIQAINDKKNLTMEVPGLAAKMARKAFLKRSPGALPVPMPYYTVKLKDGFAEDCVSALPRPGRSLEWSHRWDVRGHDCIRVQLGTLPLDSRIEKKLKKRNYRIYTETIAQDDFEVLAKRGVVRRPDEWVAVLTYHKEAYIKGSEKLPYVPAVRVLYERYL